MDLYGFICSTNNFLPTKTSKWQYRRKGSQSQHQKKRRWRISIIYIYIYILSLFFFLSLHLLLILSFFFFLYSGSPFRDEISLAVLQLQENNRLEILKRRWWEGGQCPKEEDHRAKGKNLRSKQAVPHSLCIWNISESDRCKF